MIFLALSRAPPTTRRLSHDELAELNDRGWNDNGTHFDYWVDKDRYDNTVYFEVRKDGK